MGLFSNTEAHSSSEVLPLRHLTFDSKENKINLKLLIIKFNYLLQQANSPTVTSCHTQPEIYFCIVSHQEHY